MMREGHYDYFVGLVHVTRVTFTSSSFCYGAYAGNALASLSEDCERRRHRRRRYRFRRHFRR